MGYRDDTFIEVGCTLSPHQIYDHLGFFTLQLVLTETVTRIFKQALPDRCLQCPQKRNSQRGSYRPHQLGKAETLSEFPSLYGAS